jgi:adenine-specific DNA methylase
MIPKECKRLAEVDFPIAAVSAHSAREKSIRHGHPSTLHLWWARRPLAACRAMLLALLLPDPCDPNCPEDFKALARAALKNLPGGEGKTDCDLRKSLLRFIGDFANWDLAANPTYLEAGRALVKAAYPEEPPLVVDPFAGGGSIPLEALRLGCEAFASDLNPVACLILKVMLEDIPRHGAKLAEELRRVGKQIREQAVKELAEFYPNDPDGAKPIAYLWARTVRCEAVGCGAEIPLMRSFWLCNKTNRWRALRLVHERDSKHLKDPLNTLVSEKGTWRFEILTPESESEVRKGTVTRGNAACPSCNAVLPVGRVRDQLAAQRGGADVKFDAKGKRIGGAWLLSVVTIDHNKSGRQYRLPTDRDYDTVYRAARALQRVAATKLPNGLSPVPDEPLPPQGTLGFRVQLYGMLRWGDLFTARQKLALSVLCERLRSHSDAATAPVLDLLALCVGKVADLGNAAAPWKRDAECPVNLLGSQRIRQPWEWAESMVMGESSGSFFSAYERSAAALEEAFDYHYRVGQAGLADARELALPDASAGVYFTDPPYYNAIPYADLSDFFFVWLKRSFPGSSLLRDPFDSTNPLTPKLREAVQDETKVVNGGVKDRSFFENTMGRAFGEGRRVLDTSGIGAVVFAHKTTEGWEALLSGLAGGRWTVTASWPIATEMAHRPRARDSAALATSVHLVCRPRPSNAGIGGWEDILRDLPNRIGDWMERLSGEGIRGADLVFSCIGPALELFSKYEHVETAEGREVKLDEFLVKVWEVVGRTALQQILGTAEAKARNSAAGALEEDARLTALFLWTLQSTNSEVESREPKVESEDEEEAEDEEEEAREKTKKGYALIYDVARRFAQPLGIHMENWEGRIIETKKGIVRLISVQERAEQLFGEAGTQAVGMALERSGGRDAQFTLFPDQPRTASPSLRSRRSRAPAGKREDTTEAPATRRGDDARPRPCRHAAAS